MVSIKRIIQAVATGVVLMQLATGFGIATAGAQEPDTFPAEELDLSPEGMDMEFEDFEGFEFEPGSRELTAEDQAVIAGMIVFGLIFLVVAIAIAIFILWLLSNALAAVPQEYRDMEPGMVWLLLIPLFNLVWNFFVYRRISSSYQRYFAAQGITGRGDCGDAIGLWYSICAVACSIPCVNYVTGPIAGPAGLILLIIYLVKISGLKNEVKAATAGIPK